MEDRWAIYDRIVTIIEDSCGCGECDYKSNLLRTIREDYRMSSSHKDIPEYDEAVVCDNPECKHLEAPAITGLYGIAGGGGPGVYSVCEHCGIVLTKSVDPELCETHEVVELKDATDNTKPGTDHDK